jgi:transcriptional regulator with XRE-family HTH domain
MDQQPDNRFEIRDFLASRRAKLTPEQVGLPTSNRRRVPGLRREEVAVLAGVSTEWYTRLEKGHISGVSEDVLKAVAQALQLDEAERTYLADLARAARPAHRAPSRRKDVQVPQTVQWLIDSITLSAAFVRNGRMDVVATNPLARALHAPMFDSDTTDRHGRANIARYHFLDPGARHFFVDWNAAASATVALLRAEAGREPHDRALRELVGELSTLSPEFRTLWAAHDVRIRHDGIKRLQHPEVGRLELTYQSMDLPTPNRTVHDLTLYTAEPGTTSEDRLKVLASWAATQSRRAELTDQTRKTQGNRPSQR